MNIGVIGWWHHDNQGDLAMLDNLTRALAPHRLVPIDTGFAMSDDTLQRLNRLDFLLLGGGTQFQTTPPFPFDTFEVWGQHLRTPLGAIGIGVDMVSSQHLAAVNRLVEQAEFFYVRDQSSRQVIGHPKVQLAPDLTFLNPITWSSELHRTVRQPATCGVNLRNSPGLDTGPWVETLKCLPYRLRGIPFSTYSSWQEMQLLRQIDENCAVALSPSLYDDLDLMIGTAFHSVVFAVQAAVPVIAIAYAPKVRHFMQDIGLEDYVLRPDEWHKLPALAERVLDEHDRLVSSLCQTTAALTQSMRQAMDEVKARVNSLAIEHMRSGPRVSLAVIGNASVDANQCSIQSCLEQTYPNLEVLFVGHESEVPPVRSSSAVALKTILTDSPYLGDRVNQAISLASGEYLSWILAGDFYAHDAIDCMVDRLQREATQDMVFTDYYTIQDRNRIIDVHSVHESRKLIRRNVVGPCFLYRRRLSEAVGTFRPVTRLIDYDYWLRARAVCRLQPMHVPLFYTQLSHELQYDRASERQVRRQWRSTDAWPLRVMWRMIDTDLTEALVIHPLLVARRAVRDYLHRLQSAGGQGHSANAN